MTVTQHHRHPPRAPRTGAAATTHPTSASAARPRGPADRLRPHVPLGVLRQDSSPSGSTPATARTATLDRFGDAAWINGGSPTEGFLNFGADGPFKEFYNAIAGDACGRLAVHARPARHRRRAHFGVGDADRDRRRRADVRADVHRRPAARRTTRSSTTTSIGVIVSSSWPSAHAGDTWGLGHWWSSTALVQKHPVLR